MPDPTLDPKLNLTGPSGVLNSISLGINVASVIVPEVINLANAVRGLLQRHPDLTPEQLQELVAGIADNVLATNARTSAVLDGIKAEAPAG